MKLILNDKYPVSCDEFGVALISCNFSLSTQITLIITLPRADAIRF